MRVQLNQIKHHEKLSSPHGFRSVACLGSRLRRDRDQVKSALASDELAKTREINVGSFRGTVQLSGFVSTSGEKDRAGRIAASVEGVQEVKNNITVK